jgi:hypothetical protein
LFTADLPKRWLPLLDWFDLSEKITPFCRQMSRVYLLKVQERV